MAKIPAPAHFVHAATGAPTPPSYMGYWTFVTASIILMFILYTAQKGTLGIWLGFFSWSTPKPLAGSASSQQTSPNQANPNVIPETKTPGQPGLIDPTKDPWGFFTGGLPTSVQSFLTGGAPGFSQLLTGSAIPSGASGVVQSGGNEILNPGPAFNPFTYFSNWFGGGH